MSMSTSCHAISIRQMRHLEAGLPANENPARDRRRAEAVAHRIDRRIDEIGAALRERERELYLVPALEVRNGDPDQREPSSLDLLRRGNMERSCRLEDQRGLGRRPREGVRTG